MKSKAFRMAGVASLVAMSCATMVAANPLPEAGDPIVITGNRTPQERSRASVVVDVIKREQIEASGASNVLELLESIGGVSINRLYGRNGVDASVDVGAMGESGSQNVLVLIDGVRLNTFDSASVRFAQLPISAIESIEIRKTNGGSLYGDRAQGGVIQILTRRDTSKEVSVNLGSFGQQQASAHLGFGDAHWNAQVALSSGRENGYREHSASRQESAFVKWAGDMGAGKLNLQARGFEEEAQLPSYLSPSQFQINPRKIGQYPANGLRKGQSLGLGYAQELANGTKLSLQLSQQQIDDAGYYDIRNERTVVNPEWRGRLGQGEWSLGAEWVEATANTAGSKQVAQNSQAVYGQWLQALNARDTVDLSARTQRFESQFRSMASAATTQTDDQLSAFGLGLNRRLAPGLTARAGLMTGFRLPNADELYYFDLTPDPVWGFPSYLPLGVANFIKPMRTREAYAELTKAYERGRASAHLRHIQSKDEIGYASDVASVAYPCGGSGATVYGCNTNLYDTQRTILTLQGQWQASPQWSLKAGLDWVDARIDSGLDQGKRLPLTARHVLRWSAEKSYQNYVLMLAGHYRGAMVQSADAAQFYPLIPSRHVMDLGVRSRYSKAVSWSLWVRNLTDKSYYDFAQYNGLYPANGRSIHMAVKMQF